METLVFPTQDQLSQHQEYWNKRMVYNPRSSGLFRSSSTDLSAPLSGVTTELRPSTAGGRVNARKPSPAKNGYNNNKGNKSGHTPKTNNNNTSRNKIPNTGARVLESKEKKCQVKKNGSSQKKDEGSSPPRITILPRPTCPKDAMAGLATITGMSLSEVYRIYEKKGESPPVEVLKQEVVKQVNKTNNKGGEMTNHKVNRGETNHKANRDDKANSDGETNKKANRDGEAANNNNNNNVVKRGNKDGQTRKINDVHKVTKAYNDVKASPKEETKAGEEVLVTVIKQKDEQVVKKTTITTTEELFNTPIRAKVVKASTEVVAKYETNESVSPMETPTKEGAVFDPRDFSLFEKWAGPACTNSPPPSSLPLPSFIRKRKEFGVSDVETSQMDTEAATRGLRRLLNLDV